MDVEKILKDGEKKFGSLGIYKLGSTVHVNVPSIKTGVPQLDVALGTGGLPQGRIIEIYGDESCGKTTLALQSIANFQNAGKVAAFVDAEHALDREWATKLGVDVDELLFSQPDYGEQALEVVEYLVESEVGIVVVDSVAALTPKAEIDGDFGESHVGLQARLMSQAMRKLTAKAKKAKTAIIFINQTRMRIGVLYGDPRTTSGGNALKFYSSVRLSVSKQSPKDDDKENGEVISQTVKIKVVKNKLAPPHKLCETKIVFKEGFEGFNLAYNLFNAMLDTNILVKEKNSYYLGDEKIAVGKGKAVEHIMQLPEEELEKYYSEVTINMDKEYQKIMAEMDQIEEQLEEEEDKASKKKLRKRLKALGEQLEAVKVKHLG